MKDIKNKALRFIKVLEKKSIPVDKAYLFGSHAKGTASSASDIDICIVSKKLGKDYFREMVKLRLMALRIDDRIEPVPFGPRDLNDKYNTLAFEIRKYGILLS